VREYLNQPDLYYRKDLWIEEAIQDREGEVLTADQDFETTHWYQFQLAAKAHLAMVMDMLKGY